MQLGEQLFRNNRRVQRLVVEIGAPNLPIFHGVGKNFSWMARANAANEVAVGLLGVWVN